MSGPTVRPVSGAELLALRAGVDRVYAEAFADPPWQHGGTSGAGAFLARLTSDVGRPGFVAALALAGGTAVGFATGWTTSGVFPSDRCHPQANAALGPERTAAWLSGGREVDELAVAGAVRGRGIGAALLEAVTADVPDGRCWLMTPVRAVEAMAFYRHLGWIQATHPAPEGAGHAVFLGPRHPARTAVPLPI